MREITTTKKNLHQLIYTRAKNKNKNNKNLNYIFGNFGKLKGLGKNQKDNYNVCWFNDIGVNGLEFNKISFLF